MGKPWKYIRKPSENHGNIRHGENLLNKNMGQPLGTPKKKKT
jgi:hypothetical protein